MARTRADRSSSREASASAAGTPRSPLYRGLVKATFSLRPDQLAAVRQEARRRADVAGTYRTDAGEVVREAIDLWLRRQR